MVKFRTLYKMDSIGNIRSWEIWVDGNTYYQRHGVVGGTLQTTSTTISKGKNIGKVNETTKYQQAELEAHSLWNKQKDRKGYSEEIPRVKELRPMLAKSFDKDGKHIEYPCYVQSKLDGLRCIAQKVNGKIRLISRQGKQFTSLTHLEKQLSFLPSHLILDGELYVHGEDFQDIISAVKRDKPSKNTSKIEYHIYDLISEEDYNERFKKLKLLSLNYLDSRPNLKLVYTGICKDKKDVWKWHSKYINKGYEGIMLRNFKGPYKIDGRSFDLQKVKTFIDMEFPIVDAEENKGKMAGQCSFFCVTQDGKKFKVKPQGTDEQRRQYWRDWQAGKLRGKLLTVKFFSWTLAGVPRFPIGICVRDYE